MPYEYLDDGVTSDVTLCARGATLDELFTAASDAVTNLMVEQLDSVRPLTVAPVELFDEALDLLLVKLLDEILFHKDASALLLRATSVHVASSKRGHHLSAELRGERIDPTRHQLLADPKAVTLHGLRVAHDALGWSAHVTIDV
ncbi:MAG: archease [Planctomycetota bacterium]